MKRIQPTFDREDWILLSLFAITSTFPTILSFVYNLSKLLDNQPFLVAVLVIIVLIILANISHHLRTRSYKKQISDTEFALSVETIRLHLKEIPNNIYIIATHMAKPKIRDVDQVRANVMLIYPYNKLHMEHFTSGYDHEESELEWGKGNGCCGMSWMDKKQRMVDLSGNIEEIEKIYSYPTLDHIKHTRKIKSLITTPIIHIENGIQHVIGILNIDSIAPKEHSKFEEEIVYKYATAQSRKIGAIIMKIYDIQLG